MKSLSRISRKVKKNKSSSQLLQSDVQEPREDRSTELSPNEHLAEILKDNVLCWFFKAFLNKQYCGETLGCWLEVESLRYLESSVEVASKATYIFQQYIASEAPKQVNVNEDVRQLVEASLEKPSKSMFDDVQVDAFNLMVNDSYTKFVGSGFYHSYLEGDPAPTIPKTVSAELLDRYLVRSKLPTNKKMAGAVPAMPAAFLKSQSMSVLNLPPRGNLNALGSIERQSPRRLNQSGSSWTKSKSKISSSPEQRFIVADFAAEEKGEISLKENTVVDILDKHKSGWWKVKASDGEGWVPESWLDAMEFHAEAVQQAELDNAISSSGPLPVPPGGMPMPPLPTPPGDAPPPPSVHNMALPSPPKEQAPAIPQVPNKPPTSVNKVIRVSTDPGPKSNSLAVPGSKELKRTATPALIRPAGDRGRGRGAQRARGRGRGGPRGRGQPPRGRGRGVGRGPLPRSPAGVSPSPRRPCLQTPSGSPPGATPPLPPPKD